ncbi:hypothetical protein GCM10025865_03020 [Paraoerskovia sediminicola]|uniref:Thioredoxin domain-containing protein n=1 Tax=Paraoerskovia sediminicola TaxID=1138587 RepID=A0ABN6XC11_9CELL|nr:redoxin domain-containing protein [Paraoerskovia sediminicola]BDZ41003.1 hypothetical protein GCM10025865_03020 [Paraoerskovia sediminicola]
MSTTTRTRRITPIATLATLALVTAGCAGTTDAGDDAAASGETAATETAEPTEAAEPTEPAEPTEAPEDSETEEPAEESEEPAEDAEDPVAVPAAFEFSGDTVDGAAFDAATLAGEPTVLWFWAPWCHICRGEGPAVAQVAADLDGEVAFVGVPGLGEVDAMQEFVDDTGTGEFIHVVDDDGSLWQKFGVVSQPSFVFIDADGETELVVGAMGHDDLESTASALVDG